VYKVKLTKLPVPGRQLTSGETRGLTALLVMGRVSNLAKAQNSKKPLPVKKDPEKGTSITQKNNSRKENNTRSTNVP